MEDRTMATRTIVYLYDSHDDAVQVVRELESAGISRDHISIVASNRDRRYPARTDSDPGVRREDTGNPETAAAVGAGVGAVLGGGAGLLAGVGALTIPGLGPVVAAGWLASTLVGVAAGAAPVGIVGGLIGVLTGAGLNESDPHVYAEGVRRGGTLVIVRTDDDDVAQHAGQIMRSWPYVDIAKRRAEYEASGWTRFEETDTTALDRGADSPTASESPTPSGRPRTMV
jgi:hypothetical protein